MKLGVFTVLFADQPFEVALVLCLRARPDSPRKRMEDLLRLVVCS